jgi:cytochrome c peroxidase
MVLSNVSCRPRFDAAFRAPMVRAVLLLSFFLATAALVACTSAVSPAAAGGDDAALRRVAAANFSAVPAAAAAAPAMAELGRALFWDERISSNGKTSCGSCHTADAGGGDRRRYSTTANGGLTPRNSITVFNSMSQPALRWVADRPEGAAMAEGLLTGPLGFKSLDAARQAMHDAGYADRFKAVFNGDAAPLSTKNYGIAVAAYQATLATPAPFDRYLSGDNGALTPQQKRGLQTFVDTGCAACHRGPLLGGQGLQKFGLTRPYWEATKSDRIDDGRYAVTKKDEDRYVFRVPMLRNIAQTAPYFHDGSVATLDDAVRVMADVQLGRKLDDRQVAEIVAFLGALSGNVPANYAPPGRTP